MFISWLENPDDWIAQWVEHCISIADVEVLVFMNKPGRYLYDDILFFPTSLGVIRESFFCFD